MEVRSVEEEKIKLPIIGEAELCVLSGTLDNIRKAICVAKSGRKVIIAIKETYLAEDICSSFRYSLSEDECNFFPEWTRNGRLLHPDKGKNYLEFLCQQYGISLLYGVYALDCLEWENIPFQGKELPCITKKKIQRVVSKGGCFGILCDEVWKENTVCPQKITSPSHMEYTVLTGGLPEKGKFDGISENGIRYHLEGKEEFGLLTVSKAVGDGTGKCIDSAESYVALWEAAIDAYKDLQKDIPSLKLGRFAMKLRCINTENAPGTCESIPHETSWISFRTGDGLKEQERGECIWVSNTIRARKMQYDLVVAGGGTAGAMTALYAARGGLKTVLIEPQYTLGGTSTVGGVSTYWFGNRFSDIREIDKAVESVSRSINLRNREGIWSKADDFHPGIRGLVLTRLCIEAGVDVHFGQICFGAICTDRQSVTRDQEGILCEGVVTVGDRGPVAYYGKAVVDATGDADVAAFSGGDVVYGSERDYITYWSSLAQYTDVDKYQNNFSSMVIAADPVDVTRFILVGRKRGEKLFDHGSYVSMRESRHIKGKYTVTLKDLMDFKTYEDGLYTCYSNYDPKGKLDADAVYCGVLPPQVKIQIPLSALIPCDVWGRPIERLYVAGKAISATHNVFPSIRMQPDLMHQGAVLGGVLAKGLSKGIYPEQMAAEERRKFLRSFSDDLLELPICNKTLLEQVNSFHTGSRSHWTDVPFVYEEREKSERLSIVTASSEQVLPFLRERLRRETVPYEWRFKKNHGDRGLRIDLIGFCLFHGYDADVEEFCDYINEELDGDVLPERKESVMCVQLLPDHGVMPEIVYCLNLLGWSEHDCIVSVFKRVLKILEHSDRDYENIRKGIFHYVESFAYVAEHSGKKEFIPMLIHLVSFPEFQHIANHENQVGLMTERLQILQFILYRALAKLGTAEGVRGLERMTDYPNLTIRLSAKMELERGMTEDGKRKKDKIW